ncbi:hypothetical protein P9112_012583 [Eukaryota sp. TZLM1-RC]
MKRNCVCVLGPTASGKSDLAISIAQHLNGCVVNCDIMQTYNGCPIATNHPSHEDFLTVQHQLFGVAPPFDNWDIHNYKHHFFDILNSTDSLPVVTGGSFYYLEAVLFQQDLNVDLKSSANLPSWRHSDGDCYSFLCKVDPDFAKTVHPKDTRKVLSAINHINKGILPSKLEQSRRERVLRMNPVIIWLDCSDEVLFERIRNRVDLMLEKGIVEEALEIARVAQDHFGELSPNIFESGILQSIGVKELVNGFRELGINLDDPPGNLRELTRPYLEEIKTSTIRYVKRQRVWFNSRLANCGLPVFCVHSDVDVKLLCASIQETFASFEFPFSCPLRKEKVCYCEICDVFVHTEAQMQIHVKSKVHYKRQRSKRRLESKLN